MDIYLTYMSYCVLRRCFLNISHWVIIKYHFHKRLVAQTFANYNSTQSSCSFILSVSKTEKWRGDEVDYN